MLSESGDCSSSRQVSPRYSQLSRRGLTQFGRRSSSSIQDNPKRPMREDNRGVDGSCSAYPSHNTDAHLATAAHNGEERSSPEDRYSTVVHPVKFPARGFLAKFHSSDFDKHKPLPRKYGTTQDFTSANSVLRMRKGDSHTTAVKSFFPVDESRVAAARNMLSGTQNIQQSMHVSGREVPTNRLSATRVQRNNLPSPSAMAAGTDDVSLTISTKHVPETGSFSKRAESTPKPDLPSATTLSRSQHPCAKSIILTAVSTTSKLPPPPPSRRKITHYRQTQIYCVKILPQVVR